MKRKAIQLAHKTIVVSLPAKWVEQHGVKKGDEIDVEEIGDCLSIGPQIKNEQKKISLDVSGIESILHRVIGALYKAGYSEIKFTYNTAEELSIIQKTINRSLMGFEAIEQSKNQVVVQEISKVDSAEFEKMFKKSFLLIISSGQESLEAIQNLDGEEMKKVVLIDDAVNRCCDFCRRLLNIEPKIGKPPSYFIIEQIEKIGDIYRDICRDMALKPFKLSSTMTEIYRDVNSLFYDFYELFYKFELKKIDLFSRKAKKIREKIVEYIPNVPRKEIIILIYLKSILESTFDMNGPLLTQKL